MRQKHYPKDILVDIEFHDARADVLTTKLKHLKEQGLRTTLKAAASLNKQEIDKLWESGVYSLENGEWPLWESGDYAIHLVYCESCFSHSP